MKLKDMSIKHETFIKPALSEAEIADVNENRSGYDTASQEYHAMNTMGKRYMKLVRTYIPEEFCYDPDDRLSFKDLRNELDNRTSEKPLMLHIMSRHGEFLADVTGLYLPDDGRLEIMSDQIPFTTNQSPRVMPNMNLTFIEGENGEIMSYGNNNEEAYVYKLNIREQKGIKHIEATVA